MLMMMCELYDYRLGLNSVIMQKKYLTICFKYK